MPGDMGWGMQLCRPRGSHSCSCPVRDLCHAASQAPLLPSFQVCLPPSQAFLALRVVALAQMVPEACICLFASVGMGS